MRILRKFAFLLYELLRNTTTGDTCLLHVIHLIGVRVGALVIEKTLTFELFVSANLSDVHENCF